jgi:hypothetical protein
MAVTPNSFISPQSVNAYQTGVGLVMGGSLASPTNDVQVALAGGNGARLVKLLASPWGSSAQCNIYLFRNPSGTKIFADAKNLAAWTFSGSTLVPIVDFGYSDFNPLIMAPNESITCAISAVGASAIGFCAEWMNF